MTERKPGRLRAFIKSRDGFIVILVLCIMILLFAFGGGMLIAASTTLGGIDATVRQEQLHLAAVSASDFIRSELATSTDTDTALLEGVNSLSTNTDADPQELVTVTGDGIGETHCYFKITEKNGKPLLNADIVVTDNESEYKLYSVYERTGQSEPYLWKFKEYKVN